MSTVPAYFRLDGWVKGVLGPATAGAMVFLLNQPANTTAPVTPKGQTPQAFVPNPQVQLYADPLGQQPITQPIITDGFGHYDAYVAYGTYCLAVYVNSVNTPTEVYNDQSIGVAGTSGGIFPQTIVKAASEWLDSYNSVTGAFTQSQPEFSDLGGSLVAADLPLTLQSGTTLVAPALGTPVSGTLTNCTFPTLNQSTTGTAASFTGSLTGDVTGTQSSTSVVKINGTAVPVSAVLLGSNISGQLSAVTYATVSSNLVAADVPTLNQSTSGNAATATALSVNGTNGYLWTMTGVNTQGWTAGVSFAPTPLFAKTFYTYSTGRNFSTVYQNTSGNAMLVSVSGISNGGSLSMSAVIGATSSPATVISEVTSAVYSGTMIFMVPNNYYYEVTETNVNTASAPLPIWVECVLNSGSVTFSGELSGSRTNGSVYQNTSGYCIFVIADIYNATGGVSESIVCDSSASPTTTVVDWISRVSPDKTTVCFPVPNGYYYKYTGSGSTTGHWNEYTMPFQAAQSVELGVNGSAYAPRMSGGIYSNWAHDVFAICSGRTSSGGGTYGAYVMSIKNNAWCVSTSVNGLINNYFSYTSATSSSDAFVTALAGLGDFYSLNVGTSGTVVVSHYFEWYLN